ncbi:GMC oxidoreductase [Hypoxylon sp. EC38]|nr:GMC oxidoreductase [Hypoxylon sp. EC38]
MRLKGLKDSCVATAAVRSFHAPLDADIGTLSALQECRTLGCVRTDYQPITDQQLYKMLLSSQVYLRKRCNGLGSKLPSNSKQSQSGSLLFVLVEMVLSTKTAWILAALVATKLATPVDSLIKPRRLLGSSFGVPGDNATYDYVIVGGGTAGLTLATRLVEQNAGTVAVIEAGTFYEIGNSNISQVPAQDGAFAGKGNRDWQPLIDWGYMTTPQAGANNKSIHYARGKCLGGSSARNYMVYQRGTKSSYSAWATQVGDESYQWDNFLPYFQKSVNFSGPNMHLRFANSTPEYDITAFGTGTGPLSVTYAHYAQAFGTWAQKGLEQLGISVVRGFSSGSLLGQSYSMFTINAETGIRDSSETSFLRKALGFPNYTVYQMAMAKRILFNGTTAVGVLVDTQGFEYTLSARKEVILSAGVFGSPQLLQVSGVGPADLLGEVGIPVVADRPGVGQNMQDHIYFGVTHAVNAPTISSLQNVAFAAAAATEFNEHAGGMYANPTTDTIGWEKVPEPLRSAMSNETLRILNDYPDDWPEVEYISLGGYVGDQEDSRHGDPNDGHNYASLAVALCTPQSRGTVRITSADTYTAPEINPNFLVDAADQEVVIAGFKRARQFWNTDAMSSFSIGDESYPGLGVQTDSEILEAIKASYNTIYHGASTCAMGCRDDEMSVVDSKANVVGVDGLRVVDASTFPFLPPGHPMATVYAFAEKIACDISDNCGDDKGLVGVRVAIASAILALSPGIQALSFETHKDRFYDLLDGRRYSGENPVRDPGVALDGARARILKIQYAASFGRLMGRTYMRMEV